ncbi:hypothetical protein ACPWT1_08195 [Ramlibacter sp. MMS24-I3-19]|uniref:hypothetical protein n=1 Tax=Ramlibacter sp. MMS24-I3-19 TaxID=3416606 RepID=UPI003D07D48E
MYKTDLFLLGAHITVLCVQKETRDSIEVFFDGALASQVMGYASTPDYEIRIDGPFSRELIRGRPPEFGPLTGVSVTPRGGERITPWHHLSPPLPPTEAGVLRKRFVGFHAAAVMNGSGAACLLVGLRGSGKSSLSIRLAQQYGHVLLTDEETFLHSRSLFVEPFPRAVHIGTSSTEKVATSYVDAGLKAPMHGGVVRTVFLLQKSASGASCIQPVGPADALMALLQHQRAWGSPPLDSYATTARIAGQCQVFVCRWSEFGQIAGLAADIDGVLSSVIGRQTSAAA